MSSLLSSTTAQVSTAVVASALFFAMFSQQRKSSALKTAISENSKFAPSYLPVAIFVGGTAGIGQGTVEAFARHTHGNAHIIIVGRNRTAAEAIISGLPKPTADGAKYEFVECDITSMKNIERTTASLLERLPRVNFLVISTAALAKMGRDETEEGLDKKLTLFFYGRWKFVEQMLPALRNAASKGEVATIYNVAAAGKGKPLDWDNLGLKKTYSVVALREQSSTYLDVISQELAAQNPGISFAHAWPGTVRTNLGSSIESTPIRLALKLMLLLSYPVSNSYAESGEYMLYGILTASKRAGWSRYDEDGTTLSGNEYIATEEERKRLWAHAVEETSKWKSKSG